MKCTCQMKAVEKMFKDTPQGWVHNRNCEINK